MNINSSRNSLLRARNLRSARRSRAGKVISSKTLRTNSSSKSSSTKRTTTASTTKTRQLSMYEQIEKSANSVQVNIENMLKIGKMTYTDDEAGKKAKENDKETLIKDIKNFVSDFNQVQSNLCDIGGVANLAFKKTLDSIVSNNKQALTEIGITVSGSGELSINEKTLASADFDKVKALFAKDGGFADKIGAKMGTIENAASNSLTTLSKLYGATATYNKYGTSNSYYNNYYGNNNSYYDYLNYGNYGKNSGWYF